ncbi:MAG TPA: type II secretion system protein [Burkholderiales bacterium]|nr:type II secretion system protein [Burkholderiales bacterium]
MWSNRRQRGVSLIELVVFIVVMGIGLAATLLLYSRFTSASVDPLIRKQALAIATTLMEEARLQPFTFCDPDDPIVHTATATTDCAVQEGVGAEGGETRYGPARFDNVSDYHGFAMPAGTLRTIDDATPIALLAQYAVLPIEVATIGNGELGAAVPNAQSSEALRITVTVRHVPTNTDVVLQGYRLRYAPRSP